MSSRRRIQVKLPDRHRFGPPAVGRLHRAEILALAADDGDGPASELGGGGPLSGDLSRGHGGKIIGAEKECESERAMSRVCRVELSGEDQNR
jgi:hypothetical protein